MLKLIVTAGLCVALVSAAGPAAASYGRSSVTVVQSGAGGFGGGGFPAGGYYGPYYQAAPTIVTVIPRPQPIYVEPAPVYVEPQPVYVTVQAPEREEPPVIIREKPRAKSKSRSGIALSITSRGSR